MDANVEQAEDDRLIESSQLSPGAFHKKIPGEKKERGKGRKKRGEKRSAPGTSSKITEFKSKVPKERGVNVSGTFLFDTENAIKSLSIKTVGPDNPSNISTDDTWTFTVRSNKNEFIRLMPDSLSVMVFGNYLNPTRVEDSPNAETAAQKHSLRSLDNLPVLFIDPTAMGTCFIKSVDVTINGVPVNTVPLNNHLLQYVRTNRIFNDHPDKHFNLSGDIVTNTNRNEKSETMRRACIAFDYETWDGRNGSRIPIFLDGVFPFDRRNRSIRAIDKKTIGKVAIRQKSENFFFPPETVIEIRLHLYPRKTTGIFHNECRTFANYVAQAAADAPAGELMLAIQDVNLRYEVIQLHESPYLKIMNDYGRGGITEFEYDIVRSHLQVLTGGVSYTENKFTIPPFCRVIYVLFLPSHAVLPMEARRKPLSGYSQFPKHCTRMRAEFAGVPLITSELEAFGNYNTVHEISKTIYYEYLVNNNWWKKNSDALFSRSPNQSNLNQILVLDTQSLRSTRSEFFRLECEFSGAEQSPADRQILVFSVHDNGRARCSLSGLPPQWFWEFGESRETLATSSTGVTA